MCLLCANYFSSSFQFQKHNTELLVNMVRQQFKRNKDETDPEKIQKLKDEYVPSLCHLFYVFTHFSSLAPKRLFVCSFVSFGIL
jgi:Complex 1 protein (LYR family)